MKNSHFKTNELDWIDKFVMHEQQNRGNSKEIIDKKLVQFYCQVNKDPMTIYFQKTMAKNYTGKMNGAYIFQLLDVFDASKITELDSLYRRMIDVFTRKLLKFSTNTYSL